MKTVVFCDFFLRDIRRNLWAVIDTINRSSVEWIGCGQTIRLGRELVYFSCFLSKVETITLNIIKYNKAISKYTVFDTRKTRATAKLDSSPQSNANANKMLMVEIRRFFRRGRGQNQDQGQWQFLNWISWYLLRFWSSVCLKNYRIHSRNFFLQALGLTEKNAQSIFVLLMFVLLLILLFLSYSLSFFFVVSYLVIMTILATRTHSSSWVNYYTRHNC